MDKGEISIMLGIIGAGNMAEAMIAGILKSKTLDSKNIISLNKACELLGLSAYEYNRENYNY